MKLKSLRSIAIVCSIFYGVSSFFYLRDEYVYNIHHPLTPLIVALTLISVGTVIFSFTTKNKNDEH